MLKSLLVLIFLCLVQTFSSGQAVKKDFKDVVYAELGQRKLLVDIYMPATKNPYLIIWVHGGAWHSGSKESPPLGLVGAGYALASVDYRVSIEAKFPAQIHDIKAAIRYLRANANKYGFRSDKIIIAGSSAGGHLAALVGTSNGDKELEGNVGEFNATSSAVQATLDYYGPTNLVSILSQSTSHGTSVRGPAMALLLGNTVDNTPDLAKKASPVFHVDPTDPPMIILHGDQDVQVPVNQSHELEGAYKKNNLKVQLVIVHGAGHSDNAYYGSEMQQRVEAFLADVLKN